MGNVGVRIQRHRNFQLVQRLLGLVVEHEDLTQNSVLIGSAGILMHRNLELLHGGVVVIFRHVGARHAGVPLLPFGMLAIELVQFSDGRVEVAFVTVGVSKIVADGSLARREFFGYAVFLDC